MSHALRPIRDGRGADHANGWHIFTVDLEEWFHGIELPPDRWPSESRLEVGLDRLLSLMERHGVRATFFVLGVVAEQHPTLVRSVAQSGHEIACHGYAHEFVYRQSDTEFRDDIRRARDAVASAVGAEPRGYRAPYFSVRKDSLWALDVLAEEGFAYDSSIFPVHNDRYGIPGAARRPHRRQTLSASLLEIPLSTIRIGRIALPFSGGAYLRLLPWWAQLAAWRMAAREGEPVIVYIHPWELDPEHPRIPLRRRVAATHYARLGSTERRLEALFRRYRFGRIDELIPTA